MEKNKVKYRLYLKNCFLLILPLLLWNIFLMPYLPENYGTEIFWKDIPQYISIPENTFRILVFVLPAFMKFERRFDIQKKGLVVYSIGLLIYFSSWLIQIFFPDSLWINHILIFTAPAYTTIIFFIGISMIGQESYFRKIKLNRIYLLISLIFVFYHSWHAFLVHSRL